MRTILPLGFIVDIVLQFWQRVPAPIVHNLSKAKMLKLIFWHLNVDQRMGFYMEFGVAHGHSMRSAVLANNFAHSKKLGILPINRSFYGIDTFEGFKSNNPLDEHPVWKLDAFTKPLAKIERRFRRNKSSIQFLKFDATMLTETTEPEVLLFKRSIQGSAALLLFDMDLYEPTIKALDWIQPFITGGTFIMFDEFFAFNGDLDKGEAKAFHEFSEKNSSLTFREFATYGSGGKVFIVSTKSNKIIE